MIIRLSVSAVPRHIENRLREGNASAIVPYVEKVLN